MNYTQFQKRMAPFTVFSLRDVRKAFPGFHRQRLNEWAKKGYIRKVIRGFYVFSSQEIDETTLFVIANTIYAPSYISLESALSYYGLIPEGVYTVTSISSHKTASFETNDGSFHYSHIKRDLFWGYRLEKSISGHMFTLAEPEKTMIDYIYLHSEIRTVEAFRGLRINSDVFRQRMRVQMLKEYAQKTQKQSVCNRLEVFLSSIH